MRKLFLIIAHVLFFVVVSASYVNYRVQFVNEEQLFVDTSLYISPLRADVDAYFQDLYKNARFNGNVLVAHKGQIIYKNTFGYADFSSREKLSEGHVFQLASVSKHFTALSIVLLKQNDRLDYNDKVAKYLHNFPFPDITIHHLLAHQSGLPNYMYYAEHYTPNKEEALSNEDVLGQLIENQPALHPFFRAGSRFNYSNTGYALLALIVEKVSGQKINDFLSENFFSRAGMSHTYAGAARPDKYKMTKGHYYNHIYVQPFYQDPVIGDKSVYSNIEDMFRWDRLLASGEVIKKEELEFSFVEHSTISLGLHGYGYGWRLRSYPDGRKIEYHTGWYRGYTSLFVRIRETDSVIIILSNKVNRSFMSSYHDLVDILYPPIIS